MKRPALIATLWLICGIALGRFLILPGWVVLLSLAALVASYIVLLRQPPRAMRIPPTGYLLLAAFGAIGIFLQNQIERENDLATALVASIPADQPVRVTGTLVLLPSERPGRTMLTLAHCIVSLPQGEIPFPARILVTATAEANAKVLGFSPVNGDLITASGTIAPPPQLRNPDVFNYEAYLRNKGIFATMRLRDAADIELAAPLRARAFWNQLLLAAKLFRQKSESLLDNVMSRESAEMVKSLFLGQSHYLEPGERRAFLRTGLMHIFSVSGLHVGMIVLLFYWLFRLLRFSLRANIVCTLLGVAFYAAMVGFRAPVTRAAIMSAVLLLSFLMRREIEPISALAFAAFLVLIFSPRALWQVDFQLSYACVASIILFKPILEETLYFHLEQHPLHYRRKLFLANHYILDPLHVVLAVQIGLLPLIVNYYHYVSFIAPLAQLVIVPLTFLIIALAFVISIFGTAVHFIAVICGSAAELLVYVMRNLARIFASTSFSATYLQHIPFYALAVYYVALLAGSHLLATRSPEAFPKRRASFAISLAIIVAVLIWLPIVRSQNYLYVCFLDVGQGDSAYVEFPTGENLLIDGGSDFPHDQGAAVVVPFLQARGVNRLDAVIASHADRDHIGGLPYVLESLWVSEVIEGSSTSRARTYAELERLIDELGISHIRLKRGDVISGIPDASLTILHPTDEFSLTSNQNNKSVVLRIGYGTRSFIFTGDAEREAEKDMIAARLPLRTDVLKVAHHGSKNSTTKEFLDAVQPRVALISVGANNRYGHPNAGTIERCEAVGARVFRTDRDGAIEMRTDGARLLLRATCLPEGHVSPIEDHVSPIEDHVSPTNPDPVPVSARGREAERSFDLEPRARE
jgi:competence protein ComEC